MWLSVFYDTSSKRQGLCMIRHLTIILFQDFFSWQHSFYMGGIKWVWSNIWLPAKIIESYGIKTIILRVIEWNWHDSQFNLVFTKHHFPDDDFCFNCFFKHLSKPRIFPLSLTLITYFYILQDYYAALYWYLIHCHYNSELP